MKLSLQGRSRRLDAETQRLIDAGQLNSTETEVALDAILGQYKPAAVTTPQEGFESAQYLVSWAESQLQDLEALLAAFVDSGPATMIEEVNPDTKRNELKIRFKPVPHKIRGLSNNIVKDLRDALDQVTSAACHLVTGVSRRNCHFPFAESPDDFDVAVTRNQCKDIPAILRPVVKGYEPYPSGGNWQGGNNHFRLLGRISGPHKHRFTLMTTVEPADVFAKVQKASPGHGARSGLTMSLGLNSKGDYVIVSVGNGGYAVFDEISFLPFVAFADAKLKGIPVDYLLRHSYFTVRRIVQDLQARAVAIRAKG